MDENDLKKTLQIIIDLINTDVNNNILWRLEGSANLKLQGVNTSVRDLDLVTNDDGLDIFRNLFSEYIIQDYYNSEMDSQILECQINGFNMEILSYEDNRSMLDNIKQFEWNNLNIPVLPLESAKLFYEIIKRKEKVDVISKHLKSSRKK